MKKFERYWLNQSKILKWHNKPKKIFRKKDNNKSEWFTDGKLNLYENCIERHLNDKTRFKTAIILIDENKNIKKYSYIKIHQMVNNFCEYLISNKIKVSSAIIHSSASLVSAISMLALSKLAIHFSVIFEDLQIEAINSRIKILKPNLVITRGNLSCVKGIQTSLKNNKIKNFLVISSRRNLSNQKSKNFSFYNFQKNLNLKYIKSKIISAPTPLFTLFTSGSTGEPKGITHSTGGYLVYSIYTSKKQFGMSKKSVVLTASDAGWINGHTYSFFSPLALGATTILLEKPTIIIDYKFLKKIINKFSISILYLPVTLIRILKSIIPENERFKKNKLISIGSMGEPLASSVAKWYSNYFFNKDKPIVNTYFQTETGGIICSPKYSGKETLYGTVGKPLNKFIKINLPKNKKKFLLEINSKWPGCMINVANGKKFWNKYWVNKKFQLFDIASLDRKNNIVINGRSDDVINIRGHRIGSEEIESILLKANEVVEAAAISIMDELEGSRLIYFIKSKDSADKTKISKIVNESILKYFGSYALPKNIIFVRDLPKTKSGKILRRILRLIYENPNIKNINNVSTINKRETIENLKLEILSQLRN